jgi:ABC-type uncharacterized transport system permease subunit
MAFFSGTFFPLETLPAWLSSLLLLLPLSQVNLLIRSPAFTTSAISALTGLMILTASVYASSVFYLNRYQE